MLLNRNINIEIVLKCVSNNRRFLEVKKLLDIGSCKCSIVKDFYNCYSCYNYDIFVNSHNLLQHIYRANGISDKGSHTSAL